MDIQSQGNTLSIRNAFLNTQNHKVEHSQYICNSYIQNIMIQICTFLSKFFDLEMSKDTETKKVDSI